LLDAVAPVTVAAAAPTVGAAAAAALKPVNAEAGLPVSLARCLRLSTQVILLSLSCSRLCALDRRLALCWVAGPRMHGGLGVSKVGLDGQQE
jgi:hypothetical protein